VGGKIFRLRPRREFLGARRSTSAMSSARARAAGLVFASNRKPKRGPGAKSPCSCTMSKLPSTWIFVCPRHCLSLFRRSNFRVDDIVRYRDHAIELTFSASSYFEAHSAYLELKDVALMADINHRRRPRNGGKQETTPLRRANFEPFHLWLLRKCLL
jgi:hypothetical protein